MQNGMKVDKFAPSSWAHGKKKLFTYFKSVVQVCIGKVSIQKVDVYKFLLILGFIGYVIISYDVSIDRLYRMQAGVLDLGLAIQRLWMPLHTDYGLLQFMFGFFYSSGLSFIFSPLSLFGGYFSILLFQSVLLGSGAFPIYGISIRYTNSKFLSLLFSLCYFIYFPLTGANYFDFHFIVFFIPFYLFMYYFFLIRRYKLSVFFMILASLTKYPFPIFTFMFALIYVFPMYRNSRTRSNKAILLAALFVSISLLLIGFIVGRYGPSILTSQLKITTGLSIYDNAGNEFVSFLILFAPVLFLPFFSWKSMVMMAPYAIETVVTHNTGFLFPAITSNQYGSLFTPFVFTGLLESLKIFPTKKMELVLKLRKFKLRLNLSTIHKYAILILVISILFATIFEPVGPLNDYSTHKFAPNPNNSYYNKSTYINVKNSALLIPESDPYVLVPDDIPEVFPRPTIPNIGDLVTGFTDTGISPNLTISDINNDSFPVIVNNVLYFTKVDYALGNMYFSFASAGNPSFSTIASMMYQSGKYGIEAEANGTILLSRNYTQLPLYYVPFRMYFGPSTFFSVTDGYFLNGTYNFQNISKNILLWKDAILPLLHGHYQVSVSASFNGSSIPKLSFQFGQQNYIVSPTILGNQAGPENILVSYNFSLSVNGFYDTYNLESLSLGINGHLDFRGVTIVQISPQ